MTFVIEETALTTGELSSTNLSIRGPVFCRLQHLPRREDS